MAKHGKMPASHYSAWATINPKRKLKILSVFGTRPEAVKMAPIVKLLAQTAEIESRVCVTAQHRQMLDQVLSLFEIKPDYDLNLMRDDQSLAQLSAAIFTNLDPVFEDFKPDWVLAQGDTTTVAITSLLAYYRRIKFGHVEAGLRTHDKWQPFPEEINRRVAGVIADLHFAPTDWSRQNLLNEGISKEIIKVTGNTVIDALQFVSTQPEPQEITQLVTTKLKTKKIILVTAHRRENFGEPMENICRALFELSKQEDIEIVYPVHLNPNVQEPVNRLLKGMEHITLLPPLDYLPLVHLMKHAALILTDSGVESGALKLVGTETSFIVQEAKRLLEDNSAYAEMSKAVNPYGDGHAAEKIIQALLQVNG
jgi:UDP-N-acetylglucosamine 2-epimerase (non-hydrolysing)